ncbi:hypothetical protein PPACK8108_LOCUS23726 [Phakopsora pachyrhizi]|uniref:Uncharacterized protein n=1 Tax=Phakopsora pachyrhizi TaxID=170000 RepID=A0AAV0BRC3_PHAPC|nr:hypothetical protein PPACK8108_LOCUS23726 [Phakopsora pachyrhizi]
MRSKVPTRFSCSSTISTLDVDSHAWLSLYPEPNRIGPRPRTQWIRRLNWLIKQADLNRNSELLKSLKTPKSGLNRDEVVTACWFFVDISFYRIALKIQAGGFLLEAILLAVIAADHSSLSHKPAGLIMCVILAVGLSNSTLKMFDVKNASWLADFEGHRELGGGPINCLSLGENGSSPAAISTQFTVVQL